MPADAERPDLEAIKARRDAIDHEVHAPTCRCERDFALYAAEDIRALLAEVERLHQEILRLRAGHADLAAMHAEAVANENRRLVRSVYRSLRADGSLWCESSSPDEVVQNTADQVGASFQRFDIYEVFGGWRSWAVEALPQPAPQAGADLHMTVRQAEEGSDG